MKITALIMMLSFCIPCFAHGRNDSIVYPAERTQVWAPLLKGKKVAYAGIASSVTGSGHSLDLLIAGGADVVKIFTPEHGFSGMADAGEKVSDSVDERTGIPLVSLYGKVKKPTAEHLEGVDVIVFDMPEMGCRFNTKLITMQWMMESAAVYGVEFIVFDRPNPNGHYVDGNILDTAYRSGVGQQPVPVVHGMTAGEYATMLNEEGWLRGGVKCRLTVVPCLGYSHANRYYLPMFATPNLRTDKAINLYPSVCFFEGTELSEGRGTEKPFEVFGSPYLPETGFSFVPKPMPGAKSSKHYGKLCNGMDLSGTEDLSAVDLKWLVWAYENYPQDRKKDFFKPFFDLLAGGPQLRRQIESGMSAEEISRSWRKGVREFKKVRARYLLYEDFPRRADAMRGGKKK